MDCIFITGYYCLIMQIPLTLIKRFNVCPPSADTSLRIPSCVTVIWSGWPTICLTIQLRPAELDAATRAASPTNASARLRARSFAAQVELHTRTLFKEDFYVFLR